MSRWFRHYAGMMRDDKLVRVALRCKQSIERVVWIYGAILESAAEIDDDGRYDFDVAEAAYFYGRTRMTLQLLSVLWTLLADCMKVVWRSGATVSSSPIVQQSGRLDIESDEGTITLEATGKMAMITVTPK